jgi:BirA family biotin operon repressor/biotin-[acetyl-CoA-carboxylase] ligase
MLSTRQQILKRLGDARFHSGTDLGAALGVSRAAVCKAIQSLAEAGLPVESVPGRGYRLPVALEPLDRRAILKHLGRDADPIRDRFQILETADSTSRELLSKIAEADFHGAVCVAESQPSGRGRRGRHWITTPYHNLMLSIGWRFPGAPAALAGLSLAGGLAVLEALDEYGVTGGRSRHPASRDTGTSLCGAGLGLKWPNDILWDGRKLGGLLVDLQGEAGGPCAVVFGVGINGYLDPRAARAIDQPWVDLHTITGRTVSRNRLAALVIRRLRTTFERFARAGFAPFRAEWERRHVFQGRRVRLLAEGSSQTGTVLGIDAQGALRLRDDAGREQTVFSGDLSLRPE